MPVEDVRLLYVPEQDVGGISLWSAVSCCMTGVCSKAERGCLQELCKASNTVWK